MKVKELIEKLKEFDPELDVTSSNGALYSLHEYPGYYDGCFTKLYQDKEQEPYWNITGCKIESKEPKLVLSFLDWEEVITNESDAVVDYDEYSIKYKDEVEKHRSEIKRIEKELNEQSFKKVIDKMLQGYKIVQPKTERIGVYNQMWYISKNDKELKYENHLTQGECAAILELGRFEYIEKDDFIHWVIKHENVEN